MRREKIFDLEERTSRFGECVLSFVSKLEKNEVSIILIKQIVRSSTSIGANYMEANTAESKKDFLHKMGISNKEAKESKHWLRMLEYVFPKEVEAIKTLKQEAQELNFIFSSIIIKTKNNNKNYK